MQDVTDAGNFCSRFLTHGVIDWLDKSGMTLRSMMVFTALQLSLQMFCLRFLISQILSLINFTEPGMSLSISSGAYCITAALKSRCSKRCV